jgi:hypothetical protein
LVISGIPDVVAVENIAYTFAPTVTGQQDVLVFSVANLPEWAVFDPESGQLSGTPDENSIGVTNEIGISVSDGFSNASILFSIEVTGDSGDGPIGDIPPTLVISGIPDVVAVEDIAYTFAPTVTGQQDVLEFLVSNKPSWATFNKLTGQLMGIPNNEDVGNDYLVTISVSDGDRTSFLSPFDISIFNVNDPPEISGVPPNVIMQDTPFSFTPVVVDIDNPADPDDLAFTIANPPGWADLAFNTSTGELSATPQSNELGAYNDVVISVSDGMASDTLTFSILVLGGKKVMITWNAPTTREDGQSMDVNELLGFQLEYYEESAPGTVFKVGTDDIGFDLTSYETDLLGIGTWYFALRAVDTTGLESALSNEVNASID